MRILFAYRYGIIGGVCTQLFNRLRYLNTIDDVQVEVCLGQDYGAAALLSPLCSVHVLPEPERAALLASPRFDAVLVIDTPEMIAEARKGPAKLIVEVHTTVERGLEYLQDAELRADAYLVPSEYSRRMITQRFGIPHEHVGVLANIVDGELFHPQALDAPPRPIVSWVGKLDEHKRWPAFLEVGAQLSTTNPEAELWMFGGETSADATVEVLMDALAAGGLADRCRWFPRVAYEAMPTVHSAVAQSGGVTMVTSRNESFGMSVAEALLAGCPAVVTNVGALPELAPNKPYLQVYDDGDWDEAARCAQQLLGPGGQAARHALAEDRAELAQRWARQTVGPTLVQAIRDRLPG